MKKYPKRNHPKYDTLKKYFDYSIKKYKSKIAFVELKDNSQITFEEFGNDCIYLSWSLNKLIDKTNTKCAIIAENSVSYMLSYFATILSNNVAVLIAGDLDEETLVQQINRADYEFYPQIPSEGLKLGVGTYHATICLDHDSYGTNSAKATFEVTPKPVTLNWTKTTIDISEKDLNPQCEIEGLAPIDKLGFKLVKKDDGIDWETTDRAVVEFGDYYKYNSPEDTDANVVAYYPRKYRPTEEGKYKVDVRNIVYRLTGIVDKNYVLTGETSVNYVIVDKSTVEEKGQITVGTIDKVDKTVINGIKLNAPTEEEMLTVISKLSETDSDGALKLLNALNADKNVNVYLVANTLEDTSGIILPTNNCIVVDLQLFAYVEGSNEQYPLTDTGTYNFGIDVTLTKKQADDLGYGPGKCFYIARYHGTNTPEYTQMAEPIVSGTGDDTTYTFKIRSNKFSDYAIYIGNKPVHIETEDHVIPYTGA